ncbi:MAG: L,D-transpeptidase family protein [Anaerostipes sp.]|jgi:hypothetical protein|nr:L,D-transpeptidase family protein [Anaerostipes sp.]MDD3746685.1 L,D-transpeptidase family protein [Anaerostipes sp.]
METTETNRKGSSLDKKKIGIIAVAVVAVIYIIGVIYFGNHYLFGTKIGNDKIGGKTISQVESILTDNTENYKLKLTGRKGQKDTILGKDIELKINGSEKLTDAMSNQNRFLWFLGASSENKKLTADTSYDEEKLTKVIKKLSFFDKKNIIAPQNAKISLNDKDKYVIQKEIYGTTLDKEKTTTQIQNCLSSVTDSLNLKDADCYKNPTLFSSDTRLKEGIKEANQIADVTITYDFDYTTEVVDKSLIKNWITFDKDSKASLNYNRVLKYIESLAKKYDTYSTVRRVADASGEKHKILFGSYGWKISQTKEAKKLMKDIKAGKDLKREPTYMFKALCRKEGNVDWDDTYVLVNISSQSMVFIKNGKVAMSSSVVTGDPTKGHSTPTGAYQVMYKTRNQTLTGQGYASPVSYWMPFTTNVGFHDASWRGSFGGSSYRGNGSHGCVNMPSGNAAALYSMLEKGTPVFVY